MGGGHETFLWACDADPVLVDTLFYACNRAGVAESLNNIPSADHPTVEELESYIPRHKPSQSLAWSPHFSKLCAWLNDYCIRKNRESQEGAAPSGAFDYNAS